MYAVDIKFAKNLLNECIEARARMAALTTKPARPQIQLTEKAMKELLSDPNLTSSLTVLASCSPVFILRTLSLKSFLR